jgi:hypothetical protein
MLLRASLIAVAAAMLLEQPQKMRCYRTFAQQLVSGQLSRAELSDTG